MKRNTALVQSGYQEGIARLRGQLARLPEVSQDYGQAYWRRRVTQGALDTLIAFDQHRTTMPPKERAVARVARGLSSRLRPVWQSAWSVVQLSPVYGIEPAAEPIGYTDVHLLPTGQFGVYDYKDPSATHAARDGGPSYTVIDPADLVYHV